MASPVQELLTARLVGERPRPDHLPGLLAIFGDPRVAATLWPGALGGPRTAGQVAQRLSRDADAWERDGFGPWILREAATGEVVARGGLQRMTLAGREEIEITYAVAADRWGEGLATEVASASVRAAFEDVGLDEIVALTLITNRPSRRVMEKTGLVLEGEVEHAGLPHVVFRRRRDPC